MTAFQNAINNAIGNIQNVAGVSITYIQDSNEIDLTAVVGMSKFSVSDVEGLLIELESKDFIFDAADLTANGCQLTPQRKDIIEQTIGNDTWRYEVARPDGGEQVYRVTDAGRRVVRVHTSLLNVETGVSQQ